MSGRLPSGVLVSAMLRRTNDAGGFGVVLARGDEQGGAILAIVAEPGGAERLVERGLGATGRVALIDSTPAEDLSGYWRRRRARDPDLWVIELQVAGAERLVAETIAAD
ncbi:DUF1491 family protein [Sphingomonas rubra]|uniref:DUF1491 domain-containing protein n=1 Tax=Sphingomonas rubra TaxID=634430 RepID=A0A1I5REI7_9SPHN|nr:DUF1491 family protein [Sphingomonas rubra]SFP56346.1 hypothetical protein SAMN04488241_103172 [Sphingomonas rubra]